MNTNTEKLAFPWRMTLLMALIVAAILVTFGLWGDSIDAWMRTAIEKSGENRLLVASIIFVVLASDILLPVPSSLASTLCGVLLGPALGFAVSFVAMMVSAVIGYEIGVRFADSARRIIGENDSLCLERLHAKGGRWLLLALRPVPVLAEASALFAGIARQKRRSAYLQLVIGNAAVSGVYVAAGAYFSAVEGSASTAFLVCITLTALCMVVSSRYRSR